ncbi:MAG: hypothetical protein RXP30_00090 [Thermoplasmata archaeon]|jgi:hypothetical protein|nr:hypothetical protein [Euryarchaeota archaeon]MVT14036.1 hypothetical protein [Euryarchaeota archaeon]MVT35804.1 hypothetical protein [Euryarchaeota archaeon]
MGQDWASIGIKKGTKELLNKVSSHIIQELERADLTWDEIIIYLSYVFEKKSEGSFDRNIKLENYYSKDEVDKIRKKLKIV